MEYLGSLGRLVGLRCASTERVGAESRYSVRATVEGRRQAQVVPASPRAWDVSWGAGTNPDIAALSAFTSGAWGSGPWHWVSVQAQRGNLLTPREAGLLDVLDGAHHGPSAPFRGADGAWAPRSLWSARDSGFGTLFDGIPVLEGRFVTWAADVVGSGVDALGLTFYDVDDNIVSGGGYGGAADADVQRVTMTRVVPRGAVRLRVGAGPGTTRLLRPQVTWTDGPVPYSAGHGCRAAVVDGLSADLLVANRYGTYSSAGFTVLEVG